MIMEEEVDKAELGEWISEYFDSLLAYVNDKAPLDYFSYIGVSLTIFTIFETSVKSLFDDYALMFSNTDSLGPLNLPKHVLKRMLPTSSKKKNDALIDGILDYMTSDSVLDDKRLIYYLDFKHFNQNDSNSAILETSVLFEKTGIISDLGEALENKELWFQNLSVIITNSENEGGLFDDYQETQEVNVAKFVGEYSDNVRHILAHKIPTKDMVDGMRKYKTDEVIYIFKTALMEMYKRYCETHNRTVFANSQLSQNIMDYFKSSVGR